MILDLKHIYRTDGECADVSYEFEAPLCKGICFATSISVNGKLENRAGVVALRLGATVTLHQECDRCLCAFDRAYTASSEHILVRSLEYDEGCGDDYIVTQKDSLDLDELAVSDLLLAFPTKTLCSEDCKGLCSTCGANLNTSACDCD